MILLRYRTRTSMSPAGVVNFSKNGSRGVPYGHARCTSENSNADQHSRSQPPRGYIKIRRRRQSEKSRQIHVTPRIYRNSTSAPLRSPPIATFSAWKPINAPKTKPNQKYTNTRPKWCAGVIYPTVGRCFRLYRKIQSGCRHNACAIHRCVTRLAREKFLMSY